MLLTKPQRLRAYEAVPLDHFPMASFDDQDCKRVLDYLAVAEVIESLEDLVQFVRDLSPCLAKVTDPV